MADVEVFTPTGVFAGTTLRVPLLVVGPGIAPGVRDAAVSLADIAPSILHAAGITPPPEMHGRDLVHLAVNTLAVQLTIPPQGS